MSDLKPKSWTKTIPAGVATNVTGDKAISSPAITIQNNTGAEILVGGSDSQDYRVANGDDFPWDGIDDNTSGTQSHVDTDDIFVLSAGGGDIAVITGVKK